MYDFMMPEGRFLMTSSIFLLDLSFVISTSVSSEYLNTSLLERKNSVSIFSPEALIRRPSTASTITHVVATWVDGKTLRKGRSQVLQPFMQYLFDIASRPGIPELIGGAVELSNLCPTNDNNDTAKQKKNMRFHSSLLGTGADPYTSLAMQPGSLSVSYLRYTSPFSDAGYTPAIRQRKIKTMVSTRMIAALTQASDTQLFAIVVSRE